MLPVITPSANAMAGARPWFIEVPMIAIVLGPGLATAIKYAT